MKRLNKLKDYKHIFVMNEKSGNEKGKREIMELIGQVIKYPELDYNLIATADSNLAKEFIINEQSHLGKKIFYAIGGDGTLNHMINTLMNCSEKKELPIIQTLATGTGNDFVRTLYQKETISTLDMICSDSIAEIDLLKIEHNSLIQYAANNISLGLDEKAMEITEKLQREEEQKYSSSLHQKNSQNRDFYNQAILKAYFANTAYQFELSYETEIEKLKKKTLIAFNNGQYYGKGKRISPNSKLDDGQLEVISVEHMNHISLLPVLGMLLSNGKHVHSKKVSETSTKCVTIKQDGIIKYQRDGERDQIGEEGQKTEVTISCVSKALKLKR